MADRQQAIDWSKFVDEKSAVDLFKNSIRQSVDFDWFAGKTNFKVVALSPSIPLTAKAAAAIPGGSAGDNRAIVAKYIVFGRIIEDNSPHSWIPNPCEPDKERGQQETLNLIMAHTCFIVYGDPRAKMTVPIKPGDIFLGKMTPNRHSFDLQYGKFVDVIERGGGTQYRMRFAKDCDSLAAQFPTFPDFSDGLGITARGAIYNGLAGTNVAIENGKMPSNLLGQVDTTYSSPATMLVDLIPSWNALAKGYYEWTGTPDGGGSSKKLAVNGSYRTFANAVKICGGIEPAGSPRAGRCKNKLSSRPGTSKHGWGTAIDWKLTIGWGDKSEQSRRRQFNCPEYRWMFKNARSLAVSHEMYGPVYWLSPSWARPACSDKASGRTTRYALPDQKTALGQSFCGDGTLLEAWHWESNIFSSLITGIK